MIKTKGKLSISRPYYGSGKKAISIQIEENNSSIHFLEIEIDLARFSECLTGLSMQECEMTLRNLENVGKYIERKKIVVEMPVFSATDKEVAIKLAKEKTPNGWTCSEYFGSQKSFFVINGQPHAKTTITRWVNSKPEQEDK